MVKITSILSELLKPLGFKKSGGMSWLRYEKGLLTRVTYYSSLYGGPGYIDVALTVSEKPIEKQHAGDWQANDRIYRIIPSGDKIRELIQKEVSEENAALLKEVLQTEAVPLLVRLADPTQALGIVKSGNWPTRHKFLEQMQQLIESQKQPISNG